MLQALGIKTSTDVQDYNSKYTQTFVGNFKGIAFGETSFPEGWLRAPALHGRPEQPRPHQGSVIEKLAFSSRRS
jgi:hypothetical protein